MGSLMRQYWLPACLSSELTADGDPMRLMLLGEKLIAFRDSAGLVGVLDHRCPHRCASLFFGRNEEGGLRCIYHGWKFDTAGNCLEMANIPAEEHFRDKVKARAYRVLERGGVVWVYMGERQTAPPLPAIEATLCPPEETDIYCRQRECNWLQALEGDLDTSHFALLHSGKLMPEDIAPDHVERWRHLNRAPRYQVKPTDWGAMYAAFWPAQPGSLCYFFAHFVMPFWSLFPNGPFNDNVIAQAWVPLDDTHVMSFTFSWNRRTPPLGTMKTGEPIPLLSRATPTLPNTADWFGRWRPVANQGNDYLIDREAQRAVSFSGIATVFGQDSAVTESMGAISDRTLEHLAPSDRMIIATRRRLLDATLAWRDKGVVPPLVDDPAVSGSARSGDLIAPAGQPWLEAYEQSLGQALHPTLLRAAE
jgi:phthalate 4,5-dioxygenase oxygenase subunit